MHSLEALGRARALNTRLMDEKRTELIDIEAELGGLKLDYPYPTKSAPPLLTLDEQQKRIHTRYQSLLQVHTNLNHEYEQLRRERAYLERVDKEDAYKKTLSILSEWNRVTGGGQMWPVLGLPVRSPYEFNAAWHAVQQKLYHIREELKNIEHKQATIMRFMDKKKQGSIMPPMNRNLEDKRWMLHMQMMELEQEQTKLMNCAWWKWLVANGKKLPMQ